jgi:hypothetical protein
VKAIRDRRGQVIDATARPHVYVRSGKYRGRSGVVVGALRCDRDFVALAFFDRRGELSNRDKPWRSPPDDLVRAVRCEVVIA